MQIEIFMNNKTVIIPIEDVVNIVSVPGSDSMAVHTEKGIGYWCNKIQFKDSTPIPKDRAIQILQDYIECDAHCVGKIDIKDTLIDICGCDMAEIEELGLDYLL